MIKLATLFKQRNHFVRKTQMIKSLIMNILYRKIQNATLFHKTWTFFDPIVETKAIILTGKPSTFFSFKAKKSPHVQNPDRKLSHYEHFHS